MLIRRGYSHLDGKPQEMENLDYCKRYVILTLPGDDMVSPGETFPLTIMNLSARTGDGPVRFLSSSERIQESNVYYCVSSDLWKKIPKGNISNKTLDFNEYLNPYALVVLETASYGLHYYNLNRGLGKDFNKTSSYQQMLEYNKFGVNYSRDKNPRLLPDPLYYNDEHQIYAKELVKINRDEDSIFLDDLAVDDTHIMSPTRYSYGPFVVSGEDEKAPVNKLMKPRTFRDYIDSQTQILVTKLRQSSNFDEMVEESIDPYEIEYIHINVIGIIYDIMVFSLIDEVDFCYDTEQGLSSINYKSYHKLPLEETLYREKIEMDFVNQLAFNLGFLRDAFGQYDLRIFVKGTLENLSIGYIVRMDGEMVKSYVYDNKPTTHDHTLNFIVSDL